MAEFGTSLRYDPAGAILAVVGANQADGEDHRPTADLHLPWLDEFSLGPFFQLMMLATVVGGRLMGVNPSGQPGVGSYKKHMNAYLRKASS